MSRYVPLPGRTLCPRGWLLEIGGAELFEDFLLYDFEALSNHDVEWFTGAWARRSSQALAEGHLFFA